MRKDIYNEVKRLKSMEIKINCSNLAQKLGCDPRTVKNYIEGQTCEERKKIVRESKLDNFKVIIEDKVDNHSATAFSIFNFIKKSGYTGQYGLVKKYVREHKKDQVKKATIRFETVPGLQGQVDFKEKKKMINKQGEVIEINIFLYILGYSRHKYLEITTDKSQKTVFSCLINAFKSTNGIPQEILFDNMATVVDRHNTHLGIVEYNKRFSQFSKDFGFTPVACKPYRAQTKGKVEALSKLTNRLDVYNKEFETLEELKQIANEINLELNDEISQATNKTPNSRLEEEKKALLKLPNEDIMRSYIETIKLHKVSKESMITYLGNKYSVPTSFIGKEVEIKTDEKKNELKVFNNNDLVITHKISDKLLNYKREHAIEILKSDAFKYKSNEDIDKIIEKNLVHMDILLN